MSSADKNLSSYDDNTSLDCEDLKIGVVISEWNTEITQALAEGSKETLMKHGLKEENYFETSVPGSFELPLGARMLDDKYQLDAVICIGCVIKGETSHNEYINHAVATALTQISVMRGKPFIFGVLTPNNMEQAKDRAGGKHGNKGVEAAVSAIRMARLKKTLKSTSKTIGFS